ncbi:MAG: DUF350 domain-containing protein [Methanomicrobiales archaeon]|nr:DUF350 domain-containing protein [Methanomicrobiales archaeon]
MLIEHAAVGLFQLVISIIFAVAALYLGFSVLGNMTREYDEEVELSNGNAAVGIVVAAVFVAVAIIVQSGVIGLTVGINKSLAAGILSFDGMSAIGIAAVQLILGIILAVLAIYLALNILDRLTHRFNEFEEIKKGNIAVAIKMGGVIIAVAMIVQSGVIGITAALG